jgi:hypothetical protein
MTQQKLNRRMPGIGPFLLSAALVASVAGVSLSGPAYAAEITVYKSPRCGCCSSWADRLAAQGHTMTIQDIENLDPIKKMAGVPEALQACHTALVDGYVVEGHVPAKDIARLLAERPEATGLAVPGMPGGSLGMEGAAPERYEVVLFKADGSASVYARY